MGGRRERGPAPALAHSRPPRCYVRVAMLSPTPAACLLRAWTGAVAGWGSRWLGQPLTRGAAPLHPAGLIMDTELGNLVKADRFGWVACQARGAGRQGRVGPSGRAPGQLGGPKGGSRGGQRAAGRAGMARWRPGGLLPQPLPAPASRPRSFVKRAMHGTRMLTPAEVRHQRAGQGWAGLVPGAAAQAPVALCPRPAVLVSPGSHHRRAPSPDPHPLLPTWKSCNLLWPGSLSHSPTLAAAQVREAYGRELINLRNEQRYVFLNTLFSVSEAVLYMQVGWAGWWAGGRRVVVGR